MIRFLQEINIDMTTTGYDTNGTTGDGFDGGYDGVRFVMKFESIICCDIINQTPRRIGYHKKIRTGCSTYATPGTIYYLDTMNI